MLEPRDKKGKYVSSLLEKSSCPRNQIASISGLSNAYIRLLEEGNITNVHREKLIRFAIALNLSLQEIDEMLTIFDRAKLSKDDIPFFLAASKRIKLSSIMHPLRDFFSIELMFLSAERLPGPLTSVNIRPMAAVRPNGYRKFADKHFVKSHHIYGDLIESIGAERNQALVMNLEKHPIEQYIHKESLEEYVRNCNSSEEKRWRKKHLELFLFHFKKYPNLKIYLFHLKPSFICSIKFHHNSKKYAEKIFFMGTRSDFFFGERSGLLAGFATDNQIIIENYKYDLDKLKNSIINQYLDRDKMMAYLKKLISN
jgi:transcriptional regulator with XRE-family HTH domain